MADELEMMRRQMANTRMGLSEKLDDLEQLVRDDVHATAMKITETVDVVREQIDSAKASMQKTVTAVKESCSVTHHVEKGPWTMMAGAAALGLAGGMLLRKEYNGERPHRYVPAESRFNGNDSEDGRAQLFTPKELRHSDVVPAGEFGNNLESPIGRIVEAFRPELLVLKGLALGALFGVLRDVVVRSAPNTMGQPLGTVFDGLTIRLGGQPIRGEVFQGSSSESRTGFLKH